MSASNEKWRGIVAQSLSWEEAHSSLEHAVEKFPVKLRGEVPANFPHSGWELLDHIRRTQKDLLDFMTNPAYKELKWPEEYWPSGHAPENEKAWSDTLNAIRTDRAELAKFASGSDVELTDKIPRGTGQTYLRTILLAVDHASYHIGQIVAVRRLLDAWPPK